MGSKSCIEMKTLIHIGCVLIYLVESILGSACTAPGQLCARKSTGESVCSPCPDGYSCRPWITITGAYGNGYCQSNRCLTTDEVCGGNVGTCCAGHTCKGNGAGQRICMKTADGRFKLWTGRKVSKQVPFEDNLL